MNDSIRPRGRVAGAGVESGARREQQFTRDVVFHRHDGHDDAGPGALGGEDVAEGDARRGDAIRRFGLEGARALERGRGGELLRGAALLDLLLSVPFRDRDVWIDALLGFEEPPPDVPDLPRGSVPYVPSGVDEILAMVLGVPVQPHDELVDLGSGLGRVVILAHLLCGARARGVEIQEPLVRSSRARCAELGLAAVTFVHANAADAELDGSIFFLYAPFNGPMLTGVLRRLEDVARRRPIVLCAVGLEFDDVPWLRRRSASSVSLTLYDSHAHGVDATAR